MAASLSCAILAIAVSTAAQTPQTTPTVPTQQFPLLGSTIDEMRMQLVSGELSSVDLVRLYTERNASIDDRGPRVNAIAALYDDSMEIARLLDAERAAGHVRGPLHGIPILIKDNIEAAGPLATTAGSLALANNVTGRDAAIVVRLRSAGAIILGRTNLSEWANFRSSDSTSGWSAMWGLTRNPFSLDRTACGSSSGSGAAVAASLAAAAIGTETDGSIACPAGTNGIVGFKPTVGLVSRRYIVPISHSQDTAGPMTRSVSDAATILTVIAGTDPLDDATVDADAHSSDFQASLNDHALTDMRIGVLRDRIGSNPAIVTRFNEAIAVLRAQGATIVDIADSGIDEEVLGAAEYTVLLTEFKADMNAYLSALPDVSENVPDTLADLIAFNANEPRETRWFGQQLFDAAQATEGLDSAAYRTAHATAQRLAGVEGIDRLLREHNVNLLLGVSNGPAWAIDLVHGDTFRGPGSSQLAAVAGYPHLTVPMGTIQGLPIGLSFVGTRWDDARVLSAGHDFELATPQWRTLPGFAQTVESAGHSE